MVATRKPQTEPTKDTPRDRPLAAPEWRSPRTPLPQPTDQPARKQTLLEKAQVLAGLNPDQNVVAALIVAQALDRLGEKLVEAAAVGRYHGV